MATGVRNAAPRFIATTAVSMMLLGLATAWGTHQMVTGGYRLTHGTVVEERGQTASGLTRAMVAWTDEDGVQRRRMMQLEPAEAEADVLPLWVPHDDPVAPMVRAHPAPFWESPFTWVVTAGGLLVGIALGLHVVGWGFITDAPRTTEELQESRGFYWRS